MAIFNIKSTNPNLSFILQKNPNTGMIMKSFRKGVIFGYYGADGSYYSYFKDGDDEMSLSNGSNEDDSFEYNDTSRYNSPYIILGFIKTLFKTALNETSEHDVEGYEHTLTLNQLFVYNTKYFDILKRYFGDEYKFEIEELSHRNYNVKLTTKKTLRESLSIFYCLGILYYFRTNTPYLSEEEIFQYASILNNINPPYFIKYVFKSNLPSYSQKKFDVIKGLLDMNNKGEEWDIKLGNSHSQRMDFILREISGEYPVIDLGCGEMTSYGFRLARILNKSDLIYHAIDNDSEITETLKAKISGRDIENINVYNDFSDFMACEYEGKFDIIMSEIFEHVELKQDTKWIKEMIEKVAFNKLIITTPNKNFNTNYLFETEEEMRLDSHIFEMTSTEFVDYFNKLLTPYSSKVTWEFIGIGDSVNGEYVTQSVVIKK